MKTIVLSALTLVLVGTVFLATPAKGGLCPSGNYWCDYRCSYDLSCFVPSAGRVCFENGGSSCGSGCCGTYEDFCLCGEWEGGF